jgi:hydrogenase expression/formation protein HypD
MKYVDEFRLADATDRLLNTTRSRASRRWTIMEVCGGQTHGLLRYGIEEALADVVELVHGPGCPVCVTSTELIDRAINLAQTPGMMVVTFGDMLRVPGSKQSLASARAAGAHVRTVYSPMDALVLAEQNPHHEIVFFAVGFETTAPATALAVCQAARLNLKNFSLLVAHVRVQPAMEALLQLPDNRIQAFLAAGHVCSVIGYQSYAELCRRFCVPVVVTGFEPVDLASGILACVEQLETGRAEVENRYGRSVSLEGNRYAALMIDEVYEPCDRAWRGLGFMPSGGLQLRSAWSDFDAERRFAIKRLPIIENCQCRSGDVLSGKIKPPECLAFGGVARRNIPSAPPWSPARVLAPRTSTTRARRATALRTNALRKSHERIPTVAMPCNRSRC